MQGYLICDACAGYNPVIQANGLKVVRYNDHARRKFSDAIKGMGNKDKSWVAAKALNYYKLLYAVERACQGLNPARRQHYRADKAQPICTPNCPMLPK